MPKDICRFRFWPAPGPNPHARPRPPPVCPPPPNRQTRSGRWLRVPGRPRPPDCCADEEGRRDKAARDCPEVLSGPGSRTRRAARADSQRHSRPGKDLLLNGAPRPATPRCGHGGGGASVRANARRLPHRRTAADAQWVVESRTSPASARRAHTGAHAPAPSLTRAAHSRRLQPHPGPRNCGLPAPRQGPTQSTKAYPPARAPGDQTAEAKGR